MSTSDLNSLTNFGLAKCPTLKGKDNCSEWEEIMKSNIRTSGCWDIISGQEIALQHQNPFTTREIGPPALKRYAGPKAEYARCDNNGNFRTSLTP